MARQYLRARPGAQSRGGGEGAANFGGAPGGCAVYNAGMGSGTRVIALSVVLGGALCAGTSARAQTVPTGLTVQPLASNLSAPCAFEFLSGGRVLYTEQFTGRVRLFRENVGLQATPVLIVPNVVAGGERGLLGLALDPEFPAKPYLYVFHDAPSPNHIRIARFTLSGDLDGTAGTDLTGDPLTRFNLLDNIPDAAGNHNGGTVRFGPDGMLYASLGDDAFPCGAQQVGGLRGLILRLRVNTLPPGAGSAFYAQLTPPDNPLASSSDSASRLMVARGLRNPFRIQVDPETGVLAIADVGETQREELSLLRPPGALALPGAGAAGANFGWPYFEGIADGSHADECPPTPPGLTPPVFDYDRTQQPFGASIISAGLYREQTGGSRNLPAGYDGDLFASDYYSGAVYRLTDDNGVNWQIAAPVPGQPNATHWATGFHEVSDWRVGPDGALWYCRQSVNFAGNTGSIGRISGPLVGVPPPPPGVPALAIRVLGNPAIGQATFSLSGVGRDAVLSVYDMHGRLVRRYHVSETSTPSPAPVNVTWDGLDSRGRAAGAGLYVVRLESAGASVSTRVGFLR
jgi:glucose/arabinose dehydrogenase